MSRSAFVLACALAPAAAGADPVDAAVRGRVVVEVGGEARAWIDLRVAGEPTDALRRCRRLLDEELRRREAPGLPGKVRVARACEPAPLPARPPAAEPLVLRVEEPLPTIDLFALKAGPTSGERVTSSRMASAADCERERARLAELARLESGDPDAMSRRWLTDAEHTAAADAVDVCGHAAQLEEELRHRDRRKKSPRALWYSRDQARSRCEEARRLAGTITRHRASLRPPIADDTARACVAE